MSTRTGRNTIDDLLRFEELLDRSERVRPSGLGFAELREPRTGASSPRPLYLTECLLIGPKENAA